MTTPYAPSGVHPVIGVDAGTTTLREADHLIRDLTTTLGLPPGTVACTHLIRTEMRRGTAVSFALPEEGSAEEVWQRLTATEMGAALDDRRHGPSEAAALAAAEHAARRSGRAVLYAGVERLTGTVTVADLLESTAIDQLTVVGAPLTTMDPTTPILTQDHIRPEWREGRLVLALVPAVGNTLAPFEVPNPTPCCADHP
ncbi:hypothetical protein OG824_06350 [Streptomyces prunicolor]|uniref:hypothetical protein n=1 Tax=Streptomyces prunicolor TaxID=67348 RepID=UPI0022500C57|nr:hypothetical protein [Streptomyces prunicolor]MCX5234851.1 hypothetical protein [Streptomyces prunicolor]